MFKIFVSVLILCLIHQTVEGYYLPGSFPHRYFVGDQLSVKVNSLTSIDTEIPYGYYTLPFCKPLEGIKDSAENLGELLMGDRIENSPYKFKMYKNESEIFLCKTNPLTNEEFNTLKKRIDEIYQVNINLDNLPAIRYMAKDGVSLKWTGYPVGVKVQDAYYVFNHLKFTVLVHKYEHNNVAGVIGTGDGSELITPANETTDEGYVVVGFEVVPCSVNHDLNKLKNVDSYGKYPSQINCDPVSVGMSVKEGMPMAYTYDVSFVMSDIKWPSRWDAYLKMEGSKVHWFSIMNSLMVITFLAGIVLVIFLRTIRRDLAHYEELDKEAQAHLNEELSGWKLVVNDVFRSPNNPKLLCIMVADGCRILAMGVALIFFAALGFMSPASRGTLITGMLVFYVLLGIVAGYIAVWLHRTLGAGERRGWFSISWRVSCFFPGISFLILITINSLLWGSHSTGAIPFSTFLVLILLWFGISVPLTLIGGFMATKAPFLAYPVRTNQIPREVPAQKFPSWILVLGAGTLPFGTLFIELFFIMSSIWLGRVYYVFGFLFVVLILLVTVCAEVSLVLTYMHLCVEDYKWWWKSFFASGSVALYIFLYSINYLVFDLQSLSGPVSAMLYLGYSLFMVIAVMLATGAVGFLTSFFFVHRLFSSVKID
ncbi:transmembrane 9 superfamily member 11-like [Rutidosis leptorrhynchoides]|uniref:transmembrane 9 superfamily member 11-like n=1 Tax=Rutidosis leptorrhynchoides TaxID=125765 RepID=UPI003A9A3A14